MLCRSVRMEIGTLATELGGLDLLVFTGGIGEHAPTVRREICEGLEHLGPGPRRRLVARFLRQRDRPRSRRPDR